MSWWQSAKPGDPVVCVDNSAYHQVIPAVGRVYIIGELMIVPPEFIQAGMVGFRAQGITYGRKPNGARGGWLCEDFRPAKGTDLPGTLTRYLDPETTPVLEVAT